MFDLRRGPSAAEQLLEEIDRLYQQLRGLPWVEQPQSNGSRGQTSAAYTAIEAQIRACADRYRALEQESEEAASLKAAS